MCLEYVQAMRSRLAPWLAVLTLTAAGAAAAAGYGLTAPKRYRATAQLLVSPVSPSDATFAGIGVLRDTGGTRTAAASAAALLSSPQIVDAAAAQLGLKRSRESLLGALDAHVVGKSDVVAVTAEDTSPAGAAQLANTFANVLIAQRSAAFQSELAAAIRRDEQLLATTPAAQRSNDASAAIARRLATLRGLEGEQDPTIRIAGQAAVPTASSWPNVFLLVGIGAAIGAGAGVLVAALLLVVRRGSTRPAGPHCLPLSDGELDELGERLEARLVRREAALAARAHDLQTKLDELREAQAASLETAQDGAAELADRERQLAARIAAAAKREAELARRAAEVALRERESAAEQEEAAAAAAAAAAAEAAAVTAPQPPASPGGATRGRYNLVGLEQLVGERGGAFPERLEEWSSYLYFLREYAASDGSLPASFDPLVGDTFGEILA
jgi:capsular polysaccharide biosynthesis protein